MLGLKELSQAAGLDVYETSLSEAGNVTYFLGRKGTEKFVGAAGPTSNIKIKGAKAGKVGRTQVVVGPTDHGNAVIVRAALSWTAPRCLGLATSVGLGDRLGLATPGHVRAIRGTSLTPVFAQQSIREMTRTRRTPDEVMDCATWGVLQEGFAAGFGSDADHLQKLTDIDYTLASGFTMFTIDPGAHVDNQADVDEPAELGKKMAALDLETLGTSVQDLWGRYVGQRFDLAKSAICFDEQRLLRAAAKYGNAVAHTVRMFRRLQETARSEFELEVSVDETASPTSPAEHYFFANELRRLGVRWVSMAPRFIGRFEKGVDYIGDSAAFADSFAQHVEVMKALGPYKISIHSGSDKFRIYPVIASLAGPYVHLKTAGTSYLEALRAIAAIDPALFRRILDFAHQRYETDKASYHVSADPAKAPHGADLKDKELAGVLDCFDGRQLLHVTFGSVLTAKNPDGASTFKDAILAALKKDEQKHYDVLARHLGRHVAPFTGG